MASVDRKKIGQICAYLSLTVGFVGMTIAANLPRQWQKRRQHPVLGTFTNCL